MTPLETSIDQLRRAATNMLLARSKSKDKARRAELKADAVELRDMADKWQQVVNQEAAK